MAITTSTAKIQFNVGSFDADTALSVPSTAWEDKITLDFPELVSPQFAVPSSAPSNKFVLYNIAFNGETVYKHPQFDTDLNDAAPTNPDVTIAVTDFSAGPPFVVLAESYTFNTLVDIVKTSAGTVANGTYTVSLRYFHQEGQDQEWTPTLITYPAINLVFQEKKPTPNQTNDTFAEVLTLSDLQTYIVNGVLADRQFEFILYPPEDRQVQEELLDNVQTFTFTTFWTGANEFRLYVLLTYQYTNHDIINLQTAYLPFTIFYLDKCAIYNCLKDLRDKLKSSSCGIKLFQDRQNRLLNANVLATLLLTGQGCGTDVSEIAEEFATICGCGCSVADTNPRQIGPDVS